MRGGGSLLRQARRRRRGRRDGTTPARGTRPHRRLPRSTSVDADRMRACGGTVAGMPAPRRYTTDAIVLSRFDLGEADRVLTLITPGDRQAQGHRQGDPSPDVAARRQPRAVRGADRGARARADVRRRHPGRASAHAWLNLRDSLESAATAWYLAELADRSLEERHAAEPLYSLLRRAYELLDAGMAPGRVARWYEMHLADELGVRPEVDRCVECDRVLESEETLPLGAAARRRRVRAMPGPAVRPGRPDARGPQAAQGLPATRHRGDRRPSGSPWSSNARSRRPCANSCVVPSSATRARWRSSTRSRHVPVPG